MLGLSLVAASGGHSSSRCVGLSLSRPLLLRSTGSRRAGSVIVAHGPSCPAACGIFPDQGSNPCPLHWKADSQPLHHQGSLYFSILLKLSWASDLLCPIKCGRNHFVQVLELCVHASSMFNILERCLESVTEETSLAYWRIRGLLEEDKDASDNSQDQHMSESLLEFSTQPTSQLYAIT